MTPAAGAVAPRAGDTDDPAPVPSLRRPRLLLCLCAGGVLLAAADTYVVVLALTYIIGDVGIGIDQLQRATPIISGFLLGYIVVLPLLGRLSDVYGRRGVLLGCLAAFAAGSLVTASAHSLAVVVTGRTLQGLGGGGLVPVTLALVADLWPAGRRGVPLGVVGAVQELGSVLGPLYGAAIVTVSSWRLIFWVNLPVSALLAAGLVAAGRDPERAGRDRERAGRPTAAGWPDAVGAVLILVATTAGALALAQPSALADSDSLGQLYLPIIGHSDWTTPLAVTALGALLAALGWEAAAPFGVRPLLPLRRAGELWRAVDWTGAVLLGGVLGCVIVAFAAADPSSQVVADNAVATLPLAALLGILFVVWERRHDDPLVDFGALRAPAAAGALAVNLAVGAALMAALVDVPIFARSTIDPDSQVAAAAVLLRLLVAVPIGALLGGLVCERLSYRAVSAAGMLLCSAMFLLMARWSAGALGEHGVVLGHTTPLNGTDLTLFVCGLGFGLVIAPVNAALLGAVPAAVHGLASALVVVARMVGMLVGLALLTAIGLRRFYDTASQIASPISLCPNNPTQCPAYDAATTAALVDELHAIFIGAAVSALAAAALGAALLRRPRSGARSAGPLVDRLATGTPTIRA